MKREGRSRVLRGRTSVLASAFAAIAVVLILSGASLGQSAPSAPSGSTVAAGTMDPTLTLGSGSATGTVVTTTTGNAPTTSLGPTVSNATTEELVQCPTNAPGPDDVPNAPSGPVTFLFGAQAGAPGNTTTIPADTLVWDTWTLTSPALVCGAETQFLPGNSSAEPLFALYVNGVLVRQDSTSLPAGMPVNGTDWNVYMSTPLYVNQTFAAGSNVTLALLSSTPVMVFIVSPGQTYESPCTSLPTELPSVNATQPYTVGMDGFS